ncbi:MAG: 50S ribosomal protein L14e [Candidatus Aenigmarchaeota archaeon]|nr:50S ribosomal protein L14e [Candidatus Aenigmarchaeota archaeon]
MVTLEVGRVCVKIAGREAGRYAVVIKKIDENFVLVTGPKVLTGVKRRRCNVEHLQPTPYKLQIKEDANDKEVLKAYEKAGLLTKLGLKKPSPEKIKEEKKSEKKAEKKPATKEKKTTKEEKPKSKKKG